VIALLYLAPALAVLMLLWLGRYPGERAIIALSAAHTPPRGARAVARVRRRRTVAMPRGGRLLAASLAGRAPPLSGQA
jgi:hypothetical protein